MTVEELIARLKTLPQGHEVVTDLHSEYAPIEGAYAIVGYDNGGYVSNTYTVEHELKAHGYVYVGVTTRNLHTRLRAVRLRQTLGDAL